MVYFPFNSFNCSISENHDSVLSKFNLMFCENSVTSIVAEVLQENSSPNKSSKTNIYNNPIPGAEEQEGKQTLKITNSEFSKFIRKRRA